MPLLALIVGDGQAERLRTALVLATATAAHGDPVRLFFQGEAVSLLRHPVADPDAARQSAAGLPTLGQYLDEAVAMGVTLSACQSSLALLALDASDLDPRVEWGGMVGFVGSLPPDARLVVA